MRLVAGFEVWSLPPLVLGVLAFLVLFVVVGLLGSLLSGDLSGPSRWWAELRGVCGCPRCERRREREAERLSKLEQRQQHRAAQKQQDRETLEEVATWAATRPRPAPRRSGAGGGFFVFWRTEDRDDDGDLDLF